MSICPMSLFTEPVVLASGGEALSESQAVLTLSLAVAIGGILTVLSRRLPIPRIVFLVSGGVLLGPEILGFVQPESLGSLLNVLVALAIGLILFEGGLTLDLDGFRSAGVVIRRLLTIGLITTWALTTLVIWSLYGYDLAFCVLAGSLVVVTGPTVIQPILKRVRLRWNLHHTLHWEGVLIDPIGVFAAVLTFEWVVGGAGGMALMNLGMRILGGLLIGFVGGEIISWLLRRRAVAEDAINIFMVAAALLVFACTEAFIAEGGLLSVTVAGLIVGARKPSGLKAIVEFKSVITEILIGTLFILLTARLELSQFIDFGWKGFCLVGIMILLVRPVSVLASTFRSDFSIPERAFLAAVAPRGVVAASMASLFALSLSEQGFTDRAAFLESFVYSVIMTTVVVQGFAASPLATLLGVREAEARGWLIVGAHSMAREVATFLRDVCRVPVVLVDGNRGAVKEARRLGFEAIFGDAREVDDLKERNEMRGVGRLLAFTDNEELNELLCSKWADTFSKVHLYRWASSKSSNDNEPHAGKVVWSWLPPPSLVSSELLLSEAAMVTRTGPAQREAGRLSALISVVEGEVRMDPPLPGAEKKPDREREKAKEKVVTLHIRREADPLLDAMRSRWIIRSSASSPEELFAEVAEVIALRDTHMDAETLTQALQNQHEAAPVVLGHGVAVPHVPIAELEEPVCAVVQLPNGMQFAPGQTEPVNLVFLLLSPREQPELHLVIMGEIARLAADNTFRDELIKAAEPSAIMDLTRQWRKKHTPFAPRPVVR